MGVREILQAIRSQDWHKANQAFASSMQQRLADRLAVERKQISIQENLASEPSEGDAVKQLGDTENAIQYEAAPNKVKLQCQECGKKWSVSPNARDPECPKCHGVDYEVMTEDWSPEAREAAAAARKKAHGEIQNANSSGQGHHPQHHTNPHHATLTKHGYSYSHTTPVGDSSGSKWTQHHTYKKGSHNVSVSGHHAGAGWGASKSGSGREHRGGDSASLDKYLKHRKEGFNEEHMPVAEVQRVFDEIHDVNETEILCGVSSLRVSPRGEVVSFMIEEHLTEDVKDKATSIAAQLTSKLRTARDKEIEDHLKRGRPYDWQKGKSDDEVRETLRSVNNKDVSVKDRSKYIALDSHGSGYFLVDKTDGAIYGIKGYGVPHKGYRYGTVDNPDLKQMAMRIAGSTGRFVEAYEPPPILGMIKAGDRVTYKQYAGRGRNGPEWKEATGRAVMRGPHGWVLNIGGKHGTPAVVDETNIVAINGKRV